MTAETTPNEPAPDLKRLREPFPPEEIEWRVGQSGKTREGRPWAKVLAYLTSRAIMDRLDEVVGPANWRNEFSVPPNAEPGKAVLCTIFVRVGEEWISKTDGAENTDFEAVKGGLSDAMKRAAVQWGVGRYLYGLGETWAECSEQSMKGQDGWRYAKTKDGVFWWKPPELPVWALPVGHSSRQQAKRPESKPEARRQATEAARGQARPAGDGAGKPDFRRLVLDTLDKVCRCETDEQRSAVINFITDGLYTDVAELNAPADAQKVHTRIREYGRKNRLQGLATSREIAAALGT